MPIIEFGFNANGLKKGVRTARRSLATISQTATNVGKSILSALVNPLTGALAGLAAGISAIKLTQIGDQYIDMAGQLEYLTGSAEKAEQAQEMLYQMSQKTGSSMTSNAQAFTRFSMASDMTKLSTEQNVEMLGNINTLMAKTGVNSAEATNAMIQLGQALASGKLQGDEYKTMAESTPALMRAIADSIGIPIGQLKEYASQGKLTSEKVATAFLDMGQSTEKGSAVITNAFGVTMVKIEGFKKASSELPLTVNRAWTKIINVSERLWDKINDETGILGLIAQGIEKLAAWIEEKTPDIVQFFLELRDKAVEAWPEIRLFLANLWYDTSLLVNWFVENSGKIPAFVTWMTDSFNASLPFIKSFMDTLGKLLELIAKATAASGAIAGDLSVKVEQTVTDVQNASLWDIVSFNPAGAIMDGINAVGDSITGAGVEAWNDPFLTGGADSTPQAEATQTAKNSTVNINVAEKVSRSDITNIANGLVMNDGRI